MICAIAGMTSDANILIEDARRAAQTSLLIYGEDVLCRNLVEKVSNTLQQKTMYGGQRAFGVSILYAGYDSHQEFQLYQSNPSGNFSPWLAYAIGGNQPSAEGLLKQEIKPGCDLKEACGIAIKVLAKTMDSTKMTSDKSMLQLEILWNVLIGALVEFATLGKTKEGKIYHHIWSPDEITQLLKEQDLAKAETGDE